MSWFAADPAAELDAKIEEATSESIPNGEMDMAVAMEITDVIRSKNVAPKQAMRGLKKRLTKVCSNPNTLLAVLKLCDVCVKNGGSHFLVEVNSKEFIDYLVEYIFKVHYDVKNYKVYSSELKRAIGTQILRLVREWSTYFHDSTQGNNYLAKTFGSLTNQGYEFPAVDTTLSGNALNFIDSQTPPDWIDGKDCMVCYNPFSVMNRKHHCRACGGVFCQTHSANNIPLVSLGILQPVRVCDDCFQIYKHASERGGAPKEPLLTSKRAKSRGSSSADAADAADEDEQLNRAIELSLQDLGAPATYPDPERPAPSHMTSIQTIEVRDTNEDEDDDDMKAAIAASLAEFKQAQGQPIHPEPVENPVFSQPAETELDFYLNIMPFNADAYLTQPKERPSRHRLQEQPLSVHPVHPQQEVVSVLYITLTEDLTAQEEEDITLFVQLMGDIKSDPAKQANILYDQNLGDLHSKVVRLKPKLNRALRASIEKYEFFLEMNNKINSITRLYDQFLDEKLTQAYNKHTMTLPSTAYNALHQHESSRYDQQFFVDRNISTSFAQSGSQIPNRPQTTGYQELPYQPTAPQILSHQGRAHQSGSPQASQEQRPQLTGTQDLGSYRATCIDRNYHQNVPAIIVPPQQSQYDEPGTLENSSAHDRSKTSREIRASRGLIPYLTYATNPETGAVSLEDISSAEYTREEPAQQHTANNSQWQTAYAGNMQTASNPPSDGISDTESVVSRYPALEDVDGDYMQDKSEVPPNSAAAVPREHASARFPLLNELNLPDLHAAPLADLKKTATNESRKYKAEPEPLIEL